MTYKLSLCGNFIISGWDEPHPRLYTLEEAVRLRMSLERHAAQYEAEADQAEREGNTSSARISMEFCTDNLNRAREIFEAYQGVMQ